MSGLCGGVPYAPIAAVDLGILNLTGFEPPPPYAWYFRQRKLGVELRDVYGRLIDGMQGAPGRIRSGGDGGSGLPANARQFASRHIIGRLIMCQHVQIGSKLQYWLPAA